MADRLISADELKSRVLQEQFKIGQDGTWYVLELIDSAPTIEAEPTQHGRWIEVQRINPTDRMAICECSECGDTVWVYDGQRTWNFCPNCGAKMDEVEE